MKRKLKSWAGRILYGSGLYRRWFRNRAVIVLFHRVDDRLRDDPISCTVDEFRASCEFFKRYFRVISLPELLDRLQRGDDISRCLVVTFDDGYLDNYTNAGRVLKELSLPACFFVATGLIGSDHVPWWDEKLSFKPGWMSWDQVRALDAGGFDVGAHTVTHIDMGKEDQATVDREIRESKRQLEAELGKPVGLFAYPFGGRAQITEGARESVRTAGFRCCLSAFGGDVIPGDNPFRVHRTPISPYYRTAYQFGFELAVEAPRTLEVGPA